MNQCVVGDGGGERVVDLLLFFFFFPEFESGSSLL